MSGKSQVSSQNSSFERIPNPPHEELEEEEEESPADNSEALEEEEEGSVSEAAQQTALPKTPRPIRSKKAAKELTRQLEESLDDLDAVLGERKTGERDI